MTQIETELQKLRGTVLDMMHLVSNQLEKSKEALLNNDTELAQEVVHNEQRVNALELSIDRDCEVILALHTPVATNLRFVIAMLKINSDLERIGDYAEGICHYVMEMGGKPNKNLISSINIEKMFDFAISMTRDIAVAFEKKDTKLARKVYKKDKELNLINNDALEAISTFVNKSPDSASKALFLFSTVKRLERVGDHVKNIAEDIIFYQEAEVVKHKNP